MEAPLLPYSKKSFLVTIRPHALKIEVETGIPWLFTATQAAHESRYGNSLLTLDANNLFGLTGDSWSKQGKPVYWIETTEFNSEKEEFVIKRPFRKYASWEDSLRDWAGLIGRRYAKALDAARSRDFPGFAKGLQEGGYATDPRYSLKLSGLYLTLSLLVNENGQVIG